MNIKNRLKKMENQIIGNDSEFCDCVTELRTFVILPTLNGKGKMLNSDEPYVEPPEFCESCGKPNPEPLHATFTINPKVELTGKA